jgi:hypothetical protein
MCGAEANRLDRLPDACPLVRTATVATGNGDGEGLQPLPISAVSSEASGALHTQQSDLESTRSVGDLIQILVDPARNRGCFTRDLHHG